jgi:hypothetical protein
MSAEPFFFAYPEAEGGIKMPNCMRCGEKLAHNYLVAMFTMIEAKMKRIIVCLKCKDVLDKKAK